MCSRGGGIAHTIAEHGWRKSWVSRKPFRDYTGLKHAIGVNSGTAGLHLCVRAAGIRDGDLVITTPFSFVASANVLLFERAVPVFVDVDPLTGNIDPELVAARRSTDLSHRTAWLPGAGCRKGAGGSRSR